jgi:four helix bundle protein
VSRDHRKLRVFKLADSLVLRVYQASSGFPRSERFGLASQLRKAAISAAANIVEGSARRTTRDYVHFLVIALGSAVEARYLASVAGRLHYLKPEDRDVEFGYEKLVCGLLCLVKSLENSP